MTNTYDVVHTEIIDGITYTVAITPDKLDVRGNALASGDDAEDTAVENEILERLNAGDTWAWASVCVTAEYPIGDETFEGTDYLGGCSYRDTKDFVAPGGYYDDMKVEAREGMIAAVKKAAARGEVAQLALVGLEGVEA